MKRQCQQFELYAAEGHVPSGRTFAKSELADAQAFVDAMRDTAVWQRQYRMVQRVEVHFLDASCEGSCGGWREHDAAGVIEMASVHRDELTLCHEVAHVLAAARYGSHAHDPWFARTYLELVYEMMGSETFEALRASFEHGRIDHDHDSAVPAGIEMGA
jgi:hypothetical protein